MEQQITAYFPDSKVANGLRFRSDSIGICRALLGRGVRTEIAAPVERALENCLQSVCEYLGRTPAACR